MALSILDGTQTATTLSTILSSGQHITAHTVVSLGTQAVTDMRSAVSGSVVSISNFPATQPVSIASVTIGSLPLIAGTVTANVLDPTSIISAEVYTAIFNNNALVDALNNDVVVPITGTVTVGNTVTIAGTVTANPTGTQTIAGSVTLGAGTAQIGSVTASISNSVTIGSLPAISGTVNAALAENDFVVIGEEINQGFQNVGAIPITGTVTANVFGTGYNNVAYSLPVGLDGTDAVTRGIGIGFHENLTADEFRIVKASVPFPVQVRAGTVTVGNTVTIAGTVTANLNQPNFVGQDGDSAPNYKVAVGYFENETNEFTGINTTNRQLPIRGTVTANTFALQGTAVTTSNFTSTTASTLLAGFNAGREVLTIFNEGAGNLHVCPGATCTTIAYQVRLSAGDYFEVPNHQTTITHSAVFATAGTARVTQVS